MSSRLILFFLFASLSFYASFINDNVSPELIYNAQKSAAGSQSRQRSTSGQIVPNRSHLIGSIRIFSPRRTHSTGSLRVYCIAHISSI
ncbi:hypothetical protein F5Y06DRAFT_277469 [Hypoxylon sp. FL0890]|nr:hypothetical protein F5Y06DRAFT_277469 [Hypoxylon sp. FL0890]